MVKLELVDTVPPNYKIFKKFEPNYKIYTDGQTKYVCSALVQGYAKSEMLYMTKIDKDAVDQILNSADFVDTSEFDHMTNTLEKLCTTITTNLSDNTAQLYWFFILFDIETICLVYIAFAILSYLKSIGINQWNQEEKLLYVISQILFGTFTSEFIKYQNNYFK